MFPSFGLPTINVSHCPCLAGRPRGRGMPLAPRSPPLESVTLGSSMPWQSVDEHVVVVWSMRGRCGVGPRPHRETRPRRVVESSHGFDHGIADCRGSTRQPVERSPHRTRGCRGHDHARPVPDPPRERCPSGLRMTRRRAIAEMIGALAAAESRAEIADRRRSSDCTPRASCVLLRLLVGRLVFFTHDLGAYPTHHRSIPVQSSPGGRCPSPTRLRPSAARAPSGWWQTQCQRRIAAPPRTSSHVAGLAASASQRVPLRQCQGSNGHDPSDSTTKGTRPVMNTPDRKLECTHRLLATAESAAAAPDGVSLCNAKVPS